MPTPSGSWCSSGFDMSLGTGLGKLKGKIFRIGHLGDFNDLMLAGTLGGVEMGLKLADVPHKAGGVARRTGVAGQRIAAVRFLRTSDPGSRIPNPGPRQYLLGMLAEQRCAPPDVRRRGAQLDRRAECLMAPSVGCSTSTTSSRAITCGSSKTCE